MCGRHRSRQVQNPGRLPDLKLDVSEIGARAGAACRDTRVFEATATANDNCGIRTWLAVYGALLSYVVGASLTACVLYERKEGDMRRSFPAVDEIGGKVSDAVQCGMLVRLVITLVEEGSRHVTLEVDTDAKAHRSKCTFKMIELNRIVPSTYKVRSIHHSKLPRIICARWTTVVRALH